MGKEKMATNTKLQKIVVLGPESTGKSTLCEALAKHYGVVDCKEYARQYLHENGTKTMVSTCRHPIGKVNLKIQCHFPVSIMMLFLKKVSI